MHKSVAIFFCALSAASALPRSSDLVIRKLDDGFRYQYVEGPDGSLHLVDLWETVSDVAEAARYNPDRQNVYHLYTRQNPNVSQPLLMGNVNLIGNSNYDAARKTVVLVHGWLNNATSEFNTVVVPAYLSAEDVNVIVVDWSAGANTTNYLAAVANAVTSGKGVARFIKWLNSVTGASPNMYHVCGHSLGGHQAGIIGRNVGGQIAYITALDAAFPGWATNNNKFRPSDGVYTEAIHTNVGVLGYLGNLADVDFYPNGGINMPGCISPQCDHARSYFYLGESIVSGGFTGCNCSSFVTAMAGACDLSGNLTMGGTEPKTGESGIYYLETNAAPPFSQD